MDAGIFTSVYVSNLPNTKAFFNPYPPALSSSSCWLCNSQAKRITKLRLREGSNQGLLRLHALFHNDEASSENEDKSGFGFFPADIFSLSQEKFAHLCTVMSKMHIRRGGYPFGSLVDFSPDPVGRKPFPFTVSLCTFSLRV